jgi:hypothetical protein
MYSMSICNEMLFSLLILLLIQDSQFIEHFYHVVPTIYSFEIHNSNQKKLFYQACVVDKSADSLLFRIAIEYTWYVDLNCHRVSIACLFIFSRKQIVLFSFFGETMILSNRFDSTINIVFQTMPVAHFIIDTIVSFSIHK